MMFKTEREREEFFNLLRDAMVDALKDIEEWREKRTEEKIEQLLLESEGEEDEI
jgi:hypothetical protein